MILNTFPYTNGHLMVAPFEHVGRLQDVDAETTAEMMALVQQGLALLDAEYAPHGYNVGVNQGRVAGAGVEGHIHMHVVPRWGGDTNFMPVLGDTRVMPQTLEQSYEALRGLRSSVRGRSRAGGIFKAYDVRGLYGDEMDGDTAYLIGRAFARVLARLARQGAAAELRVGLGRDMRLTAPEMAGRFREGLVDEGVAVLDAGMVGTEMLYFLVGSRELDGGAMVTASHNPKAYTGVKLVREGALALSGDAGIQDVRREIEAGLGEAPGGGSVEEVEVGDEFRAHVLTLIDTAAIAPMRVVADGGNGMAGPMVGPLLDRLGLDLVTTYWEPDGEFPDHEPNPLLEENRRFIIDKVRERGRRPRRSPGTATPTAASSSTTPASSWTATSSPRCWPSRSCARSPARRSSTTSAPAAPSRHRRRGGRTRRAEPRRPRLLQGRACARRAPRSAARSPATTTSATSTAPTRARSRRC